MVTNNKKAYAAILLQVCIIGLSFMFVKITLEYARPFDILAHRFTFAFLVATLPIIFGKVKISITLNAFIALLPLAIFYPSLFFAFQTIGLMYTDSSEAGMIFAVIPVFVVLLSALILKEKTTLIQNAFILLSVIGVIYIMMMQQGKNSQENSLLGMALILLSAFSTAIYTVLTRKLSAHYAPYTLLYLMTFLGFIIFNSIAVITHTIEQSWGDFLTPLFNLNYLLSILYLAIPSSLFTLFLAIYALARIEAFKVGVFNQLTTIITIAAGVLFLHEKIYYYHIVGTLIILIGIIGSNGCARKLS